MAHMTIQELGRLARAQHLASVSETAITWQDITIPVVKTQGDIWANFSTIAREIFTHWGTSTMQRRFKALAKAFPDWVRYSQSSFSGHGQKLTIESARPSLRGNDQGPARNSQSSFSEVGQNLSDPPSLIPECPRAWVNNERTQRWANRRGIYWLVINESSRARGACYLPFARFCMEALDRLFTEGSVSLADMQQQITELEANNEELEGDKQALEGAVQTLGEEVEAARETRVFSYVQKFWRMRHRKARPRWPVMQWIANQLIHEGHAHWDLFTLDVPPGVVVPPAINGNYMTTAVPYLTTTGPVVLLRIWALCGPGAVPAHI